MLEDEPRPGQGLPPANETVAAVSLWLSTGIHLLIMANGAGVLRSFVRGMSLLFAAFLIVAGNVMGQVRPNWVVGIRTRWTLSSREVWRRTHRFAARLMVGAGLLSIPVAFLLPPASAFAASIALLTSAMFLPVGYSYWCWKDTRGRS